MTDLNVKEVSTDRHVVSLSPADTLAGLGSANRELLATSLALFDDSQLKRRIGAHLGELGSRLKTFGKSLEEFWDNRDSQAMLLLPAPDTEESVEEGTKALGERQRYWLESAHSDDQLRLVLWIRLRKALGLPARMTATFRGCDYLADDMAARLIHVLDPPSLVNNSRRWLHKRGWLAKKQHANTLGDIVLPVLDELFEQAFKDQPTPPSQEERHQLLLNAIASLNQLGAEDHRRLLEETGADSLNDTALRNTLLLGGSLGAFGAGVSTAGFSAYILAAQASAFIPWVSGPGLVSFVSVLSNPVTIAGLVGGGGWWFIRSATDKVNVAIAAQVVSMLTLQGKIAGREGLEGSISSFLQTPDLLSAEGIADSDLNRYRQERRWLAALPACSGRPPSAEVLEAMAQPVSSSPQPQASSSNGQQASDERKATAAMTALTVGDIIYSWAAVDPSVIAAADFIHTADISSGLNFAQLAEQILDGSERSVLGATSQLKGYVAEQAVAAQLTAAGHTVSLPDAANEPGWDLLVDGQQVQVKFHASLDGLRQHFERYDYPVIANTELADHIPEEWADQVFFIDGLSNELVDHVTQESLGAGVEFLNPSVVSIAGAVSAAKGVLAYRRGQITAKQAVEQALLEGGVRMGLAGGGGVIGAGVGLMMFGPAGAWVLGASAPVLSQMLTSRTTSLLRKMAKSDAHYQWQLQAHARLEALQQQVLQALSHKQVQIQAKLVATPDNSAGHYLRWRLEDDYDFTLECQYRLMRLDAAAKPDPAQRLADTLREMAVCGVHPAVYQPELRAVTAMLKARPGLDELINKEHLEAMQQVSAETRDQAGKLWQSTSEKAQQGWKEGAGALARWRKSRRGPDDNH